MRTFSAAGVALLPLAANAINVLLSNDDGWAEINIREFYNSLTSAGFSTIISAPAENESGTGSSDATPSTVGSSGCEFSSCPAGSPAYGNNASMPRFNVSFRLNFNHSGSSPSRRSDIVCELLSRYLYALRHPEPLRNIVSPSTNF
jgi:hypothetical protein